MASTKLTRVSATSSEKKLTISTWIKRSYTGEESIIGNNNNGSNWSMFYFNGANKLQFASYISGSYVVRYTTNRVFNDVGAWYHLVATVDVSLASPEVKVYVNGEEQTSLQYNVTPSQNADIGWFNDWNFEIGVQFDTSYYLNGTLADLYYIQGYIHPASTFGETDSTTGIWKPKTNPTINYGGNGGNSLHLKFENSASMHTDSGSNNITLSTAGTLSQTKDCPSHNFSTLNPIVRLASGSNAYSQGANTFTDASGSYNTCFSTIGMFNGQGKYYAEFKVASGSSILFGIADHKASGVIDRIQRGENRYLGEYANAYGYQMNGNFYYNGSSTSTGYDSFTTANVIGMAVDMDNLKIYWHKDGVYQNSKDPASDNGESINAPTGAYHMAISAASSAANVNFGNGLFGTTAITSAGTNAAGHGLFEFNVPTGYTALSSKGLNE